MSSPEPMSEANAQELQRAISGLNPGATSIRIGAVKEHPDRFEILEYHADMPDGTTVQRSRLVVRRSQ